MNFLALLAVAVALVVAVESFTGAPAMAPAAKGAAVYRGARAKRTGDYNIVNENGDSCMCTPAADGSDCDPASIDRKYYGMAWYG